MDALLIATGFTGALSLIWLARLALAWLRGTGGAAASFGDARTDAAVRAVGAARREVLLTARALACRPLAQALIDARLRGAQVEVILDAAAEQDETSDLHFLAEQGLTPVARAGNGGPDYLLIDDRAVVLLGDGVALVAHGDSGLTQSFADDFAARRPRPLPTEDPSAEDESAAKTPVVTAATAELFARLRQEAAEPAAEGDRAA